MGENNRAQELSPEKLDINMPYDEPSFSTTGELTPLKEIVGQPRAVKALELGLGVDDSGYNIYASGISGLGKRTMLQKILEEKAVQRPVPADWIYVNNFDQQERPIAIEIASGKARELGRDLKELIAQLKEELPKAFQQEDFNKEKKRLNQNYRKQTRELFGELEKIADEAGFAV
ncbi:MAG: AAA family ATPase, partial [Chitinivibrionales bacterium]|nr:AAA family ATPase [Chitinivibrionales bacterium]